MQEFEKEFKARADHANEIILRYLPEEKGYQKTVFSAMRYSLMAGGKRMRPLLMQSCFEFFGGQDEPMLEPFMAAIEMIHTYSLIHDDLPAMDNDDYRRGRLTNHKVYGEAMAILAGDALLGYAYEIASRAVDEQVEKILGSSGPGRTQLERIRRGNRALAVLGEKPGVNGMLGGQVVDVELTGRSIPRDTLEFIFDYKTGKMIEASMMIGACLAGADDAQLEKVCEAAHDTGMAFQIQDDILDETSTLEQLGKPVHSDEKNEKTTWVTTFGMEQAKKDVESYSGKALDILEAMYDGSAQEAEDSFLCSFIRWLIHRNY